MVGIREVLTHNKTAYLVNPDFESATEHSLKILLEDEALRLKFGNATMDEMSSLTWANCADRVHNYRKRR